MTSAPAIPHDTAGHRLAFALIFVTPALWCVNYLVARWAPGVVAPNTLAFGRWAVAAALLGSFTAAELWQNRALVLAEWQRLAERAVKVSAITPGPDAQTAFELLFGLLARIDECTDDIVFFADEAGAHDLGRQHARG